MNNSTKKNKLYTIRKLNKISKHTAKFYQGLFNLFRYMSVVKAKKKNFKSFLQVLWSNLGPTSKINHQSKVRNNLALFPHHGWSIVWPLALLYRCMWTIYPFRIPLIRCWHGRQSPSKAIEFVNPVVQSYHWGIPSPDGIPYGLADFVFFFLHLPPPNMAFLKTKHNGRKPCIDLLF